MLLIIAHDLQLEIARFHALVLFGVVDSELALIENRFSVDVDAQMARARRALRLANGQHALNLSRDVFF